MSLDSMSVDTSIRCRRGVTAAAVVLAAYVGASALLAWASSGVATAVRASGPAPFDAAVGLAAAAAAWLVLTWLVLTTILALATTLTGTARRLPRLQRLADRVTPALVRRAAAAALGAGLAGVSLAGGPLAYAGTSPRPATATAVVVPVLDRPADLLPGWTPDRPVTRHTARTPSRVHLVTNTAHAGRAVADEVVVRRGDTLWDIAARHLGPDATAADVATEWPRWHRANRDLIGPEPDLILPGQRLRPPGS
jgi:hypothetical protein